MELLELLLLELEELEDELLLDREADLDRDRAGMAVFIRQTLEESFDGYQRGVSRAECRDGARTHVTEEKCRYPTYVLLRLFAPPPFFFFSRITK